MHKITMSAFVGIIRGSNSTTILKDSLSPLAGGVFIVCFCETPLKFVFDTDECHYVATTGGFVCETSNLPSCETTEGAGSVSISVSPSSILTTACWASSSTSSSSLTEISSRG